MQKIVFIVGPTATGKSDVAFQFAKKYNAEVISCDSMQVYQGMGIISSQPSKAAVKAVPHHLINFLSPARDYDVSAYRKSAVKIIKDIIKRGKIPVFAGGTGLYMSMLADGIFEVKAKDNALREKLFKKGQKYGSAVLHKELSKVDPLAAEKIHPNDLRRIIRALEVYKLTGKPISELQKQRKGLRDEYDVRIFCLNIERDKLYEKIRKRTDKMFKAGLLKEVKKLLKKNLSKTAKAAIGIHELKGYLNGEYGLKDAKEMIVRNTCLYSKRQLTWFRKDKKINWIEVKNNEKAARIAERIWKKLY